MSPSSDIINQTYGRNDSTKYNNLQIKNSNTGITSSNLSNIYLRRFPCGAIWLILKDGSLHRIAREYRSIPHPVHIDRSVILVPFQDPRGRFRAPFAGPSSRGTNSRVQPRLSPLDYWTNRAEEEGRSVAKNERGDFGLTSPLGHRRSLRGACSPRKGWERGRDGERRQWW